MKEIQIIADAKRINMLIATMLLDMDSFPEEAMWLLQERVEGYTKSIIENCKKENE